jgi:hypothetical protein
MCSSRHPRLGWCVVISGQQSGLAAPASRLQPTGQGVRHLLSRRSPLGRRPALLIYEFDIARFRAETQAVEPPISGRAAWVQRDGRWRRGSCVDDVTCGAIQAERFHQPVPCRTPWTGRALRLGGSRRRRGSGVDDVARGATQTERSHQPVPGRTPWTGRVLRLGGRRAEPASENADRCKCKPCRLHVHDSLHGRQWTLPAVARR